MAERKCAGCLNNHLASEMIKITRDYKTGTPVINKDNKIFGRSVYVCKNENCIGKLLKKDKMARLLKTSITQELKGQLLNELRNR